jgi:hypothetical protein
LQLTFSTDEQDLPESLVPTVLQSISSLLNSPRPQKRDVAAQVLNAVLGKKQFRNAVWADGECISGIIKWLKESPSPQQQYACVCCIWQLSFEEEPAGGLDNKYDVVALFIDIAKSAVKEKVIRVVVATFRVGVKDNWCWRRNLLTLATESPLDRTSSQPSVHVCGPSPAFCQLAQRAQVVGRGHCRRHRLPQDTARVASGGFDVSTSIFSFAWASGFN